MQSRHWVLAITKRTASICATRASLFAAGFELATATSIMAARAAIRSLSVEAVIVCRHSWSAEERDQIAADLATVQPKLSYLMHCPGCVDYDEAAGTPGRLADTVPLGRLIAAITPLPPRK